LYRNGCIEAVNSNLFHDDPERGRYFPGYSYEEAVLRAITKYFVALKCLQVDTPIVAMLTIVDAKRYQLAVSDPWRDRDKGYFDRDVLAIPETILEDYATDYAAYVKPIFDMVWQSCGFSGSDNYKNGQFVWR
jgi:hypothetical protein